MELKQSSAVPFAVTDPISGLDITKDVQLVSIESVGEGDFPYFQPNGDYTFTVVNAARDEIVAPTTFTLDVPFDGEVHRLTATTDMTIQATQADFMKVSVLKPLGSVIVAPVNSVLNMELKSSYRGIDLTADDVIIQKHKPGTPPDTAYPIKFISVTTKADGKTLDVKWQGADTMIGPFTFYVLRKGTTGLVEGEDWIQIDMNLRVGVAGMRIQPIHQASGSIFGHQGELINGWFTVYKDGIPIKLNDPGLTLTLVGSTNVPNVSTVIAIDERFEDHITFRILGKPTVASSNPVAGSFYGQFDLKAGYTGSEAVARVDVTWVPGTDMMSTAVMQQPLFANQTQKLVTQFGPVNGMNIPPWYTIEGAKVRAGSIFVNQFSGGGTIQQVVVEPGTPLNSINQLVKEISASWMKQRVLLSGFVLDLPFITDPALYQTMWRLNAETVIEMAPLDITPNTTVIPGTAGSAMSVLLTATQKRGDKIVHVPGTWSSPSVTGAANYLQLITTMDGDGLFRMTGKGTNGDVVLKGTFTSTADGITQPFEIKITADASYIFEMVPQTVNVKMWDVLSTPPFTVKIDRVEAPQRITNVRAINNAYIQGVEGNPNEWEVYKADTAEVSPSVYFIFDLVLESGTISCIGQGTYKIAAFDGVWLKINAEYKPGDRVGKTLNVIAGGDTSFTIYPTWKGKPAADKVEWYNYSVNWTVKSQTLTEDGLGLKIVFTAPANFTTTNTQFFYKVKGIPDAELVDKQTKVYESVSCVSVPKGLSVKNIDPTPLWSGMNGVKLWKAQFLFDGELLRNDDQNLRLEILGTAQGQVYITYAGATSDTTYFIMSVKPATNGTFAQRFKLKYLKDGTWYEAPEGQFTVGYQSTSDITPINMIVDGDPMPNQENLLPVTVRVGTNDPLAPNSIVPLGKLGVTSIPAIQNGVVNNDITYVNTGHLKFNSGWTGSETTVAMTFGSASTPNSTVPVKIFVPAAPITIVPSITEFDGLANTITTMTFTVSQQRLVDGTVISYDFGDSVVQSGSTVSGSISELTSVVNDNGVFTVVFTSKGIEGLATLTIPVKDSRGDVYNLSFDLNAVIDSSGFVLNLAPNIALGKKGDRITFTGTLDVDGANRSMDDSALTWTIEPAGYMTVGMCNAGDVRLDIDMTTTEDINKVITLKVTDRDGRFATHEIDLTVKPNMFVKLTQMDVKVWDKSSKTPFQVVDSSDVPQGLYDVELVDNENMINIPPRPTYQIVAESAQPAKVVMSTWYYRFSTDPSGFKRKVEVPFNIAAYDGSPYTFKIEGTTIFTMGSQAWFNIVPLYKGDVISKIVRWSGYGSGPRYVSMISTTEFNTKLQITAKASNIVTAFGIQNFRIRIDGGVEGNPTGEFEVPVELTVYSTAAPFQLTEPAPKEITGKFGDVFTIHTRGNYAGIQRDLTTHDWEGCVPSDVIELVPGSVTKDSFDVRFVKDITENAKTTNVQFGFSGVWSKKEIATAILNVTQQALHPKLTPAPGFESTGSGDVDNPVTLKQGVLNPE